MIKCINKLNLGIIKLLMNVLALNIKSKIDLYLLKNPPITGMVCMYANIVFRNDLHNIKLAFLCLTSTHLNSKNVPYICSQNPINVKPVNPTTIIKNPRKNIVDPLTLLRLIKNCKVPHRPSSITNPPMNANYMSLQVR